MYYYTITTEMTNCLQLKSNNLLIYAIIKAHNAGYYGSRSKLAELTGSTIRTVDKSLKYLVDRNLICAKREIVNKQIRVTYYVNESSANNTQEIFDYVTNQLSSVSKEMFCKELLIDPPNTLILRCKKSAIIENHKKYFDRQVEFWNLQHQTNYKLKIDYIG